MDESNAVAISSAIPKKPISPNKTSMATDKGKLERSYYVTSDFNQLALDRIRGGLIDTIELVETMAKILEVSKKGKNKEFIDRLTEMQESYVKIQEMYHEMIELSKKFLSE